MRTTFLIAFASVLILAQSALGGDAKFRKVTIDADSLFSSVAAYDVDHDGDIDIVGGGFWYEAPEWTKHKLRDVEHFERDGMPDGFAAQPYDVNQDGWMDFFEVNYRSRSFKWIEHPGAALGEWTAHTIAEPGPMESGRLYDIDGDGQLDMLTNNVRAPSWWQFVPRTLADGSKTTEFIQHALPAEMASHGIAFGDVNSDGRDDVLSGKGWAEAPADRINGEWKWHPEFEIGAVSVPFLVRDVDDDGDADLVYSIGHGYGVFWLEQDVANGERTWTKHGIDTTWSVAHYLLWEDLDQNGQPDLIAGKRYRAHGDNDPGADEPQGIYRYEFNKASRTWTRYVISDDPIVGWGLDGKAVDIDQDGDLDLLCPGRSGLYLLVNTLRYSERDGK
ncbi:MAG: VCBS repeat-containing protein [Acidobacteria bacterium]|nr:VCBS repeat-containing protein [Acidobacteriota bacterium]